MMDYQSMMGGNGGSMMLFGWLTYILVTVVLLLAIAALWKYVQK